MVVTGILLAAGAGARAGGPKALRPGWIEHACSALLDGGCTRVVVVLGAAPHAPIPVDSRVASVLAEDWADGMGRSLAAGLEAAALPRVGPDVSCGGPDAALVSLVDLPGLSAAVVARVLAAAGELRQAVFAGRPGHPVYIGAEHWAGVAASAVGDHGARDYLRQHGATRVECADLWDGEDVDRPATTG